MQSTDDVTRASGDHAACEKDAGKSLFARFLSYYEGEMHLFVADLVCSLAVAAIDLSFPQILRMVSRGLFREGPDAILAALWMLAARVVMRAAGTVEGERLHSFVKALFLLAHRYTSHASRPRRARAPMSWRRVLPSKSMSSQAL